jgi:hypothetical protein
MPIARRSLVRLLIGLTLAGASPPRASAQTGVAPPAIPSGWTEQDLLGGQLRLSTPPGAKVEDSTAVSIMAAAPDERLQTRVRVPVSGTEIVVQARNLEALAPKKLSAAIYAAPYLVKLEGNRAERDLDLADGWKAVAVFPDRHRFGSDAYVLAYAWVRAPDGRLYDLTVATWSKATNYRALAPFARQIVGSLKPGAGLDPIPRGPTRLGELLIDLDGRHSVSSERGHDFAVHRVTRLVEHGTHGGEMGIYMGWHPIFDAAAERAGGARRLVDTARILGTRPTWMVRDHAGRRTQTTLIRVVPGTSGLKCHLFISGTPGQVDALVGMARTLRVQPRQ